jgi:hypothetical protein
MVTNEAITVGPLSLTRSEEIDGNEMLICLEDDKLYRSFFISRAQPYVDT